MRTKGRVDNHNDYEHKSLNKTKRQRELLRVTHENQVRVEKTSTVDFFLFFWQKKQKVI